MRRARFILGAIAAWLAVQAGAQESGDFEWRAYGGGNAATRYAPLDQITPENVGALEIAWEWRSPDAEILDANSEIRPGEFQATPLMIDGVLYLSTALSQIAAVDARSGETLWVRDTGAWREGPATSKGFLSRGVAYWEDGEERRIFFGTGDGRLVAVNAADGEPVETFGTSGEVDLRTIGLPRPIPDRPSTLYGVTSAPLVVGDIIVVGSYIEDRLRTREAPRGDVRGFDARTGELVWTFHTVPLEGEFGVETWDEESWRYTGNANVWAPMSADDARGIVYLPVSAPTNNFFGGERPGDGLFGNSLVALDAQTGERIWHYQIVHHDIWDYDLPCAPILVDITVDGRDIPAVVQLTKHGLAFVFDRVTGEPVWPIEERPVPPSPIEAEHASPTQPFPTRPAPFERLGLSEDDVINFTPELEEEARRMLSRVEHGPVFTPIGERITALLPGVIGGANWPGGAFDPETGLLYVVSSTAAIGVALGPSGEIDTDFSHEIAGGSRMEGPRGLPLMQPPYGRITAIDLNTGEHVWMTPNGDGPRAHPALADLDLEPLGSAGRAAALVTRTLLFAGEGPQDPLGYAEPMFRAFDKQTGETLWEFELPDHVLGAPMTYMLDGVQYVVVTSGFRARPHRMIAFALPGETGASDNEATNEP